MKTLKLIPIFVLLISCTEITKQETKAAQQQIDVMSNELAKDAEAQYDIALKAGDNSDCYAQASLIAQFYLQSKDSANYSKWKKIERKHAKQLGI